MGPVTFLTNEGALLYTCFVPNHYIGTTTAVNVSRETVGVGALSSNHFFETWTCVGDLLPSQSISLSKKEAEVNVFKLVSILKRNFPPKGIWRKAEKLSEVKASISSLEIYDYFFFQKKMICP